MTFPFMTTGFTGWRPSFINFQMCSTNPMNSMNILWNQLNMKSIASSMVYNYPVFSMDNYTPFFNGTNNDYLLNPNLAAMQTLWNNNSNGNIWGNYTNINPFGNFDFHIDRQKFAFPFEGVVLIQFQIAPPFPFGEAHAQDILEPAPVIGGDGVVKTTGLQNGGKSASPQTGRSEELCVGDHGDSLGIIAVLLQNVAQD